MNTQKITHDLLKSGLTQQKLAELAKCSQSTISSLLNGKRGKALTFELGSRLMNLHRERCPAEYQEVGTQEGIAPSNQADA